MAGETRREGGEVFVELRGVEKSFGANDSVRALWSNPALPFQSVHR